SRKVVLPAPGLETRLTTNTPSALKRARNARATRSFCFKTFLRTSRSRGVLILLSPERKLPILFHEPLRGTEYARGTASLTEYLHRYFFNQQVRAFQRSARAGHPIAGQQSLFDYAGKESQLQMDRGDFGVPRLRFFLRHINNAHCQRKFVQESSTPSGLDSSKSSQRGLAQANTTIVGRDCMVGPDL